MLLADPFDEDESTRCRGAPGAGNRRTAGNPFGLVVDFPPPIELVDDEDDTDVERSGRDRGGGIDDLALAAEETVADIERLSKGLLAPNALEEVCDDARLDFDGGGFDIEGAVGRLYEVEEGKREVEANLARAGRASLLLNPTFDFSNTTALFDVIDDEETGLFGAKVGITVEEILATTLSSVAGLVFDTSFASSDRPPSGFATSPLLLFSPRLSVETVVARLEVSVLSCLRAVGAASAGG